MVGGKETGDGLAWAPLYDEQFKLEVALQNIAHQSNDNKEGVAAFLEKREAKFTGT